MKAQFEHLEHFVRVETDGRVGGVEHFRIGARSEQAQSEHVTLEHLMYSRRLLALAYCLIDKRLALLWYC